MRKKTIQRSITIIFVLFVGCCNSVMFIFFCRASSKINKKILRNLFFIWNCILRFVSMFLMSRPFYVNKWMKKRKHARVRARSSLSVLNIWDHSESLKRLQMFSSNDFLFASWFRFVIFRLIAIHFVKLFIVVYLYLANKIQLVYVCVCVSMFLNMFLKSILKLDCILKR